MQDIWVMLPLLTDEYGEAGHSIRTTEVSDLDGNKWQWCHLRCEKTFSASKRVNSRREKKAPKDSVATVGTRGGMTKPQPERARKEWSKNQNTIYRRKLISSFNDIAEENVRDRSLKGTNQNLFFVHCERHYIFYLRSTTPAIIVAVLHERMDLIYQINKRLP